MGCVDSFGLTAFLLDTLHAESEVEGARYLSAYFTHHDGLG
jgi:hypothetical protein